jgi:DNA-directed RNA polymerase subunit RPC12/RpoP
MDEEKIIVLESFETLISANLVKTKLDAYGIPCFLTDENFVSLYPIRNELFPGIRLHVFEKDIEAARAVLSEQSIIENEINVCPYCRSKKVEKVNSRKSVLSAVITSLLIGLFFNPKQVFQCMDCMREFETPDEIKS